MILELIDVFLFLLRFHCKGNGEDVGPLNKVDCWNVQNYLQRCLPLTLTVYSKNLVVVDVFEYFGTWHSIYGRFGHHPSDKVIQALKWRREGADHLGSGKWCLFEDSNVFLVIFDALLVDVRMLLGHQIVHHHSQSIHVCLLVCYEIGVC